MDTTPPAASCSPYEIYLADENICRTVTCPSGYILIGTDCIPEPSNITAIVTGAFSNEPSSNLIKSLLMKKKNLKVTVFKSMSDVMEEYDVVHQGLRVTTEIVKEKDSITAVHSVQCNCDYTSLSITNATMKFQDAISREVKKDTLGYFVLQGVQLHSLNIHVSYDLNKTLSTNSEHMDLHVATLSSQ